jgi:hypothetical protein
MKSKAVKRTLNVLPETAQGTNIRVATLIGLKNMPNCNHHYFLQACILVNEIGSNLTKIV